MSVSLTAAEIRMVHELLGVLNADTASIHNGYGIQISVSALDLLKTDVRSRVAALADDDATAVKEILAEYVNYRFDFSEMSQGSSGNTTGVSAANVKMNLRQMLIIYIPVLSIAEAIKRREDRMGNNAPSPSVPILGRV